MCYDREGVIKLKIEYIGLVLDFLGKSLTFTTLNQSIINLNLI